MSPAKISKWLHWVAYGEELRSKAQVLCDLTLDGELQC